MLGEELHWPLYDRIPGGPSELVFMQTLFSYILLPSRVPQLNLVASFIGAPLAISIQNCLFKICYGRHGDFLDMVPHGYVTNIYSHSV